MRATEDFQHFCDSRKLRIHNQQIDPNVEAFDQCEGLLATQSGQYPTTHLSENLTQPPHEPKIVIDDPNGCRGWRWVHVIRLRTLLLDVDERAPAVRNS
jgi:hypothetical protein